MQSKRGPGEEEGKGNSCSSAQILRDQGQHPAPTAAAGSTE